MNHRFLCSGILCLIAFGGLINALSAAPPAEKPASKPVVDADQAAAIKAIEAELAKKPAHPEWKAMHADILRGSRLGPQDGWFPLAKSVTRYTWQAVSEKYDANKDGKISTEEFAGSPKDFATLDRNHDGQITEKDVDWSAHALAPTPGAMLFRMGDRDANGKLTSEEIEQLFRGADSDQRGFVTLDDLQALLTPPPQSMPPSGAGGPSQATLLKGLLTQEIGSMQPGPAINEQAPDFTLRTTDGKEEITLSKLVGPKPVVLVFGNFTCGPFRAQGGNIEKLYRRYQDRANFVMIYVREAHPTDGWQMESNDRVGVSLRQPQSYDERAGVAQTCQKTLGFGMPFLVDTLDDEVGARYSGMPSRLYVIDREGKVAFKNGRGPFGFKPGELEQALLWELAEEGSASAKKTAAK